MPIDNCVSLQTFWMPLVLCIWIAEPLFAAVHPEQGLVLIRRGFCMTYVYFFRFCPYSCVMKMAWNLSWWYRKLFKMPTQNCCFPSKIALHSNKICYKVSLCEYCQWQSSKAFTGLSIHAKMVRWGRPYHVKVWPKLTNPFKNDFQSIFACSTSAITPSR